MTKIQLTGLREKNDSKTIHISQIAYDWHVFFDKIKT